MATSATLPPPPAGFDEEVPLPKSASNAPPPPEGFSEEVPAEAVNPRSLQGTPQDIASRALRQSGVTAPVSPAARPPRLRVNPNLPPEEAQGPTKYLSSGRTPYLQTEGEARQFDTDVNQPKPSIRNMTAAGVSSILEGSPTGEGPAGAGFPLLQGVPNISRGIRNVLSGNRNQKYQGGAQIVAGTMDELMPAFTAGLIERPIQVAGGLISGALTAKGAQLATKAAGGSKEAQDFAQATGFLIPSIVGLNIEAKDIPGERGAAVTGFGGKVAAGVQEAPGGGVRVGAKFGNTRVGKTFGAPEAEPEQPAIEPTTIKGEPGAASKEPAPPAGFTEEVAQKPSDIAQAAEAQQPKTVKTAQDIASQVPGARVVNPGPKSEESITRKLDSDREITDASRAQIVVPDEAAKKQAEQAIAQQTPAHEIQPIEAKDLPITAAKLPNSQEIQVATEQEHQTQQSTRPIYQALQEAHAAGDREKAKKLQGALDDALAWHKANPDPNVEWLPVSEASKYVPPKNDRNVSPSLREPDYTPKLIEDVKKNGLKSEAFNPKRTDEAGNPGGPIEIGYNAQNGRAAVVDGTHRLNAAKQAGLDYVPVKVTTNTAHWIQPNEGLEAQKPAEAKEEYRPSEIGVGRQQNIVAPPAEAVTPEMPKATTRVTDKSVRDFPVSGSIKGDTVTITPKLGGKGIGSITVSRSEWEKPGSTIGNPGYDRRELIRRKMSEAGLADYEAEGGAQAERIADAASNVASRLFSPPQPSLAKGQPVTVDGKPGTLTYLSKRPFEKSRVKLESGAEIAVPHREVAKRIQAVPEPQQKPTSVEGSVQGVTSGTPEQPQPKHGAIAVDLDKTLAHYNEGDAAKDPTKIGTPIQPVVDHVKKLVKDGKDVWIYSARAANQEAIPAIKAWTKEHIGVELPVTNVKYPSFHSFIDDRAVTPEEATKETATETKPGEPVKTPEKPFKYGSTQANIPHGSDASNAIIQARNRISESDLAGKGKDVGGEHVTVRYGIQGDDTAGVRDYLARLSPFEAKLGKTASFPPSEHSDGAAVIIAPIEAPELHQINAELEKHGDFSKPSFPEYKPHATIAYVKPEAVSRYVGMTVTDGKTFPVNEIAITNREGVQEVVPLKGAPNASIRNNEAVPPAETSQREERPSGEGREAGPSNPAVVPSERGADTGEVQGGKQGAAKEETRLTDHLLDKISSGEMPKDNNALKRMVQEFDGKPADPARMKQAQEALEVAIVQRAREIVDAGANTRETFDKLVDLYNSQPNLNVRTSTSIENQAYSTPAPLAFVADKLAGVDKSATVYEPTAGNGMLLIAANPKKSTVNELNPERAEALRSQGFETKEGDALKADVPAKSVDAVVTNPPFGSVKDESGTATKVRVDGYKIGQIDHLISARALDAMKDDGQAALILGASKFTAGGQSTDDNIFLNWLYSHYNVVGHFEVDGRLYGRQGAAWPVRVISIDGRLQSDRIAPEVGTVQRLNSWDDIYRQLDKSLAAGRPARSSVERPVSGPPPANEPGAIRGAAGEPPAIADRGRSGSSARPANEQPRVPARTESDRPSREPERLAEPNPPERSNAERPAESELEERPQPESRPERAAKPASDSRNPLVPAADEFQAPYTPTSSNKDKNVLIPINMKQPLEQAMSALEDAVGNVDKFLAKELGYPSIRALHDSFMGLQVDGIAASIHQIKNGKAVIIADQTGIGKGREAAGIIRWAMRNGHIPIFMTAKPSLFTAMYEDLQEIGSDDIKPFIVNLDESVTLPDGKKAFTNKPGQHRSNLERLATATASLDPKIAKAQEKLASAEAMMRNAHENNFGPDLNKKFAEELTAARNELGKLRSSRQPIPLPNGANAVFLTYSQINTPNLQQRVLQNLAPHAVFVLDESHNAGGESNTGEYIQNVLGMARGVQYLSATFAKRPDNMPVYFKTDMGEAIGDGGTLIQAMKDGGLPLQTVVSHNLVKAGQMFRRERSFDGIKMDFKTDKDNHVRHAKMADATTEALRAIVDADHAFHNSYVAHAQQEAKRENKANKIAGGGNQAERSVSHGEFTSVVHNFVRQMLLGIKADTAADDAIAALKRREKPVIAVDNTMGSFLQAYVTDNSIRPGDSLGDFDYRTVLSRALDRTRYIVETNAMGDKTKVYVPLENLDPKSREAYDAAQRTIDRLKIDIPVSPIDWIRQRIENAGYTVAEITGRNLAVDYSDPKRPTLTHVPTQEQNDKVETGLRFNDGRLDALIGNVAASTGISLHPSEKFKDQKPRHMIVAQAAQDINIFMQMLGRINRTGQVKKPIYTILNADLPAEKRPSALLAKKMKSLNANTSSNTESATSVKAPDMLNKYGDQIIGTYLADNPDLERILGVDAMSDGGEPTPDIARKATGRLALLPVKAQEEFYHDVEQQYSDYIAYLDSTNQNELEPKTFDYDAQELRSEVLSQGNNPSSPFGEDAVYGEYSIKAQKPLTSEEVEEAIKTNLDGKTEEQHAENLTADLDAQYKKYEAGIDPERPIALQAAQMARRLGQAFIETHNIGSTWRVEINGDTYSGAITNIRSTHKGHGNPYALSKIMVNLATAGPLRNIAVPATQFDRIAVGGLYDTPRNVFRTLRPDLRDTAKIITGNLLAAYGELSGTRGTIINFTKHDGTTEQGILLPKKFDFSKNTRGDYRLRDSAHALRFLKGSTNPRIEDMGIQSRDQSVRVVNDSGQIKVITPKAKARGGKYFLDQGIRALTGDFVSRGNTMEANIPKGKETQVLDQIMRKSALYASPSMADEAKGMAPKEKEPESKSGGGGLAAGESGEFYPAAVVHAAKAIESAYDRVTDAALQKAGLGRAYSRVERDDPDVAADLRELQAAPQYYRAKSDHIVEKITHGMTREQEKGFVLLADAASREWLQKDRLGEYQKYVTDPRIEQALKDYKPYEEDLRAKQKALGGPTIDEDYLRRVYDEHVAGVDKKVAKGETPRVKADRVITPQMANKKGRNASAEYYYNNGLHEFGPSFATRYVATNLKLAEDNAAMTFLSRATKIDPEDGLPPMIDYNGTPYFRGDMARLIRESAYDSPEGKQIADELGLDQLPKPSEVREYGLYDPTAPDKTDYQAKKLAQLYQDAAERASGTKLTEKDFEELLARSAAINYSKHPIYAGPKEITEAFQNFPGAIPGFAKDIAEIIDPVSSMIRRQVIGFGFGVPHMANVLRRVILATSPAGHLDPRGWANAWKVAFSKELRNRAVSGVDDPAFAALLKHAGISNHGVEEYRDYLDSNLDAPAWERAWKMLKASKADTLEFEKRLLSDIKTSAREGGPKGYTKAGLQAISGAVETPFRPMLFMGHRMIFGPGGIDQRARLWLYDFIRSQDPSITDDEMAHRINMTLGRYNKASWTDFQKAVRPLMLFPGWDYSSVEYNLKNPLRTWLPRAILILIANAVLFHFGKNKRKDSRDLSRLHVGNYSFSSNLMRERLADAASGTMQRAIQGKLLGHGNERAVRDALSGASSDARAFVGMLNPFLATPIEVATGKELATGHDIVEQRDRKHAFGPEKDWAKFGTKKLFPAFSQVAAPERGQSPATFALHNLGISAYRSRHKRR